MRLKLNIVGLVRGCNLNKWWERKGIKKGNGEKKKKEMRKGNRNVMERADPTKDSGNHTSPISPLLLAFSTHHWKINYFSLLHHIRWR